MTRPSPLGRPWIRRYRLVASALCITLLVGGAGCSEVEEAPRPIDTEDAPSDDGDEMPPTDDDETLPDDDGGEAPPTDSDDTRPEDGSDETPPADDDLEGSDETASEDAGETSEGDEVDPRRVALGIVGVVALVGVAAWWMIRRQDPDEPVDRPDPNMSM